MPIMYIKCPVTGKLLSTGIDARDIIPEALDVEDIRCFYCDSVHTWSAIDVVFLKSDAPSLDKSDNQR